MKAKIFLAALIMIVSMQSVMACGKCGAGLSMASLNRLAYSGKSFFTASYSYQNFKHGPSEIVPDAQNLKEYYQRLTFDFAYAISDKWNVSASLPYVWQKMSKGDQDDDRSGISDLKIMTQYLIFNTFDADDPDVWSHNLFVSGGLKVPTGKVTEGHNSLNTHYLYDLGSGSWDFLGGLKYRLSKGDWELLQSVNYIRSGKSSGDFQYGDRLDHSTEVVYSLVSQSIVGIWLSAGLFGEHVGKTTYNGYTDPSSSSSAFFGIGNLTASYQSFLLSLNYAYPLSHDFSMRSAFHRERANISLSMTF